MTVEMEKKIMERLNQLEKVEQIVPESMSCSGRADGSWRG